MIAHHKKYHDVRVLLDGGTFVSCCFERCTIIIAGAIPVIDLRGNTFIECRWEFIGAAANTIAFLAAMYGTAPELVDRTFENIRKGGNQRRADDPIVLN